MAGAELSERHREVLREAVKLFAERGYAGASLRELARRVGMQQPSLYHYFASKEELVEQVISTFGFGGAGNLPPGFALPERIEDLPRALGQLVTALYEHTQWPLFLRFLFNLTLEEPRYAARMRAMFVDTTRGLVDMTMQQYEGQIDPEQGGFLVRMVLNAIALPMIEEKLLFRGSGVHPDSREYTAFVVRIAEQALASREGTSIIREATPPARAGRRTPARGRRAAR